MAEVNIPLLDLADFKSGTEEQRKKFSQDLGKAFNATGFVTVKNHGLSQQLMDNTYKEVKKVFALSDDQKHSYEIVELAGQRGYTSKGREKAKGALTPDLKEFWQVGQTVRDADPIKKEYPENIVVSELPEFNQITREVYSTLEDAGKYLLRAIALYLNLEENYFDNKIHNGNSILRAIHYFPILDVENLSPDAVRAGAHEDINLITLLIGASADGLQLLTKEGEWFPITAREDHIVVNVGDMLQRLTNNKLSSTTHRVVNPPKELLGTSRYSVPFFLHPRSSMDLSCLDSCIDSNGKHYEDITAGEYLDERLREIGLKA